MPGAVDNKVQQQHSTKMNSEDAVKKPGDTSVKLQRRLGLASGTALIVGSMIGSGIFISPKGVLEGTGSVALSLIVWAICGGISVLGALSYVELGTAIPKAGGEYVYLLQCFGSMRKDIGPVPAFLYSWLSTLLLKPSSLSILAMTLAENAVQPFFSPCPSSPFATKCIAAVAICLITFINCYSVKAATSVQNIFTIAKLLAIAIIVLGGLVKLCQGSTQYLATGFQGTSFTGGTFVIALYNGMWAYDGWNNLNTVTEEIINPSRNLPLSLMIAIPLVTICYVLVNIAYLTAMSTSELLASEAVAVTFGERVLGPMAWCIPFFIVCSTFGAANGSCFCSGRLSYSAAREGHQVDVLSYVHVTRYTPSTALIFNALLALLMIIPSNIENLINFFSFTIWIVYGMVMVSLLVLRRTHPDMPRPYRVPIIIPIITLIIAGFLVVTPLVDNPQIEYLYATIFIFAGLAFYIPFVYYKVQLRIMSSITCFLQMLLSVVPPTNPDMIN